MCASMMKFWPFNSLTGQIVFCKSKNFTSYIQVQKTKQKYREKIGRFRIQDWTRDILIQGVIAISGKTFKLIFWKNHWYYWNKRYLSKKPLISALIWHPESGRGIIMRLPRPPALKKVKKPRRPPPFFTARRRGALLRMPRPLWGSQIKAGIQGFLLMYRLFLY